MGGGGRGGINGLPGTAGTPNTGGGGGGGWGNGLAGGSGIVIVRYVAGGGGGAAPTVPGTPTGFAATAVATNRIELAWTDNATDETGYLVARSTNSNDWTFVTLTAANATSYSDTPLATNTLYHYRVAASNAAGLSAYSYASTQTWTVVQVWQHEYFTPVQLTNTLVSGDNADPDLDGLLNWQERIAGTDPTNATSSLAFGTPTNSPVVAGQFVVSWQSVGGKRYSLLAATNLLTGFGPVSNNIPATPPMNVHTDSVGSAAGRFYRVRVETD
jgi:hypothetical protein